MFFSFFLCVFVSRRQYAQTICYIIIINCSKSGLYWENKNKRRLFIKMRFYSRLISHIWFKFFFFLRERKKSKFRKLKRKRRFRNQVKNKQDFSMRFGKLFLESWQPIYSLFVRIVARKTQQRQSICAQHFCLDLLAEAILFIFFFVHYSLLALLIHKHFFSPLWLWFQHFHVSPRHFFHRRISCVCT